MNALEKARQMLPGFGLEAVLQSSSRSGMIFTKRQTPEKKRAKRNPVPQAVKCSSVDSSKELAETGAKAT